eukprot:c6575_g2_i1 orf=227-1828(+)
MGLVRKSAKGCVSWSLVFVIAVVLVAAAVTTFLYHSHKHSQHKKKKSPPVTNPAQYAKALQLSLAFLDIQKSGKLPKNNPIPWRGDSGLSDGRDVGLDLSGGMYDAGDHIKFSLPMAFTATLLSWTVLEYGAQMNAAQQLVVAKENIRWITDYLMKAHPSSGDMYMQVGDPATDHACWERAEDMDMARPAYKLNSSAPGSDVAGEVAAALASASLVFRKDNSSYSDLLLKHAKEVFSFANTSRGVYSMSVPADQMYYNSSGYGDELLWAASWLFYATQNENYLNFVTGHDGEAFAKWGEAPAWLSWDNKLAGVQVLLARLQLLQPQQGSNEMTEGLHSYHSTADQLMCALLPDSPTATDSRTAGGLIWVDEWNSIQHAVNSALLALMYSDYLFTIQSGRLTCSDQTFTSQDLRNFAISQADYIMGNNPMGMSYLVGYGSNSNYPKFVHHRGASIPMDSTIYKCKQGFMWLSSVNPNPNVATGGLVGGPFKNDSFSDYRNNSMQNEPTTYNSAAMAGLMAGLSFGSQITIHSWT